MMNKQIKELKEKGYISGVEVGKFICQRNGFSGANKEIFDLKAQNQMLKLKLSAVIAKHKISAEAAYKKGYENGENDEYHRWM